MIRCLKKFEFSHKLRQAWVAQVMIEGEPHLLFRASENGNLDPWPEAFGYIDHPLVLSLFDKDGNRLWERVFGRGTVPGIWFSPMIAFDLDRDGIDEIYFVHNTDDDHPFSQLNTVLEKIDPRTGETLERYPFPAQNTMLDKMSYAFRHNLSAGYVNGEPVIVTEQGTYTNMYLQAYTTGMKPLWERVIKKEDKGARASHNINVYDYNNDGIDELYYGERMISLADGHDIVCCDEDTFAGHSDIVLPFYDDDGNYYLYTCRENGNYIGCDRVVTFDADGNAIWRALTCTEEGPHNHVHLGWVATVKPDRRKIAAACGLAGGTKHTIGCEHVFNAFTGEEIQFPFPIPLANLNPIDIDGDGYHEFFCMGKFYDCEGNVLAETGAATSRCLSGKLLNLPGEQILVYAPESQTVELWGDDQAVDSPELIRRHSRNFHSHMQKLAAAGYNFMPTVTCAM